MEEESHAPTDLSGRIHTFCKEQKERRKQEWESLKIALDKMRVRESILNNQMKKRGKLPISKWLKNMERTRNVVRNSISRTSTISAEE